MNTTPTAGASTPSQSSITGWLANYDRQTATGAEAQARGNLIEALAAASERDWLDCVQRLVLRRQVDTAIPLLVAARAHYPQSIDIAFALAGLEWQLHHDASAEALLREVLAAQPGHTAAALLLARVLGAVGRTRAAAEALRGAFIDHRQPIEASMINRQQPIEASMVNLQRPIEASIQAMEWLAECERKADAAAIAEAEIAAGCVDPRIHAYAATYAIQLGEFARARERYLYAYAHSAQAPEWNVPFGLASAQRYRDASHADFALFRECLARPDISQKARMTLLFGLGKAFDDIGDVAQAVHCLRQANDLARTLWPLSRKQWRRRVAARMQARPLAVRRAPRADFTPLFIVGLPRSGTTLTAELLSRYPRVRNRGELRWIWKLAQRLPQNGAPDLALLDELAAEYEMHLREDDGGDARWFIDKQPLNLLHIDLILALWPQARIIHCQRNARDNALSLWMQSFVDDTFAFASDFADIAAFQQGCEKLMAHWKHRYADSIRSLRYEDLATDPNTHISALADWLGLPPFDADAVPKRTDAINTASLWQARQPVYTRSVGRWSSYVPYLPELLKFSDT
jgi:hypothetical protein